MPSSNQTQSISEVIHNKKVPKKKQQVTGQLPVGQLDNRTTGKNTPTDNNNQEAIDTGVNRLLDNTESKVSRTRNQIKNQEIDEYLYGLINEGIANPAFASWYAKCLHQLGIQEVNRLVINSRNGNNPMKLLSYKLKGALSLHYKRTYYEQSDTPT